MIQQALLVFDGGCGFCTRAARWVERRWPSGLGEAVPSHELSDEELMGRGLSRSAVAEQVWWVGPEGNLGGAAAVARALSTTAGPWRYLGWAISRPPLAWLAPTGYRFVARHRHRLPGSSEACKV